MKRKQALSLASLLIAGPTIVLGVALLLPHRLSDAEVGGHYSGKQIWSGTINVMENTEIQGSLTISAGSELIFAPGKSLAVHGNLKAIGTEEASIFFNSPDFISFEGDKSHLNRMRMENTRLGIKSLGGEKKSIVQNSHFENGVEGCLHSEGGRLQILNNSFVQCGVSALNIKGTEIVRENTFQGGEIAISVLGGTPSIENNLISESGEGIYIEPGSEPKFLDNQVHLAQ